MPVDTRAPVQPPAPASLQQLASNRFAPMRADERARLQQLREQQHTAGQRQHGQRRRASAIGATLLALVFIAIMLPLQWQPASTPAAPLFQSQAQPQPQPQSEPQPAGRRSPPNTQQQLSFLTETVKATPLAASETVAAPTIASALAAAPAATAAAAETASATPAPATPETAAESPAVATTITTAIAPTIAPPITTTTPTTMTPTLAAATPAPAPLSTATTASADTAISGQVERWAAAWAARDVEAYLGFYADDFVPDGGLSRARWAAQRRQRLRAPAWITVKLDSISISAPAPQQRRVTFVQDYRSPRVKDRTRKALTLELRAGRWQITREQVLRDRQ